MKRAANRHPFSFLATRMSLNKCGHQPFSDDAFHRDSRLKNIPILTRSPVEGVSLPHLRLRVSPPPARPLFRCILLLKGATAKHRPVRTPAQPESRLQGLAQYPVGDREHILLNGYRVQPQLPAAGTDHRGWAMFHAMMSHKEPIPHGLSTVSRLLILARNSVRNTHDRTRLNCAAEGRS